jgi:hypothetical protein
MPKYRSKAQLEDDKYQELFSEIYPALKAAMQEYLDAYDWSRLADETERGATGLNLFSIRLVKLIKPIIEDKYPSITASMHGRLRTSSLEIFMQPMRAAEETRQREEARIKEAAAAKRAVVEEHFLSRTYRPGDLVVLIGKEQEKHIMVMVSSERRYGDPDEEIEGAYLCRFAAPTEEEKASPQYQQWQEKIDRERIGKEQDKALLEDRREANLNAIRESGREPDYLDEFFAGEN